MKQWMINKKYSISFLKRLHKQYTISMYFAFKKILTIDLTFLVVL